MNGGPTGVYFDRALWVLCDLRDPTTAEFVRRMRAAFGHRAVAVDFGAHHVMLALCPGAASGLAA